MGWTLDAVLIQELSDHATKVRYKWRDEWYPGYYHNRRFLPTVIGPAVIRSYGVWLLGPKQPCGCYKILVACATREEYPWKYD